MPTDRFSNYTRLKRVSAWVMRFACNSQARVKNHSRITGPLSVAELDKAASYWLSFAQNEEFANDIASLKKGVHLPRSSRLVSLNPYLDTEGLLRVGGRTQNSKMQYCSQHPVILHGKHPLSRLIMQTEHLFLMHAGPLLLSASLGRRYHFIRGQNVIRPVTKKCVVCRRRSSRPQPPLMGQLPKERVTPDAVFDRVGVDYAGPVYVKHKFVRKPTIVKAYVSIFVSLSVKAVHLELVSDLTSEAFLACLRRFIARRGRPSLIWSDHGTNFVGAARQLKELFKLLQQQKTTDAVTDFCSTQGIVWDFIPERAPHFGGLWEAAVESMKKHLSRIVGNAKLTFEELTTVLTQIEACLNSRPLTPVTADEDGIDALTSSSVALYKHCQKYPPQSLRPRFFDVGSYAKA